MTKSWKEYTEAVSVMPLPPGAGDEAQETVDFVSCYDMEGLVEWMKETFPLIKHRVVLSHGDMTLGNCLVRKFAEDAEERVYLLDFDFSRYGYRGADIGCHFFSRTMEMKELYEGKMTQLEYPSENERRTFIRDYLDEVARLATAGWKGAYTLDPELDCEEQLLLEAEFFACLHESLMHARLVQDLKKFPDLPIHPAVMTAVSLKAFDQRRARVTQMTQTMSTCRVIRGAAMTPSTSL